jgi:hypothetical protein
MITKLVGIIQIKSAALEFPMADDRRLTEGAIQGSQIVPEFGFFFAVNDAGRLRLIRLAAAP